MYKRVRYKNLKIVFFGFFVLGTLTFAFLSNCNLTQWKYDYIWYQTVWDWFQLECHLTKFSEYLGERRGSTCDYSFHYNLLFVFEIGKPLFSLPGTFVLETSCFQNAVVSLWNFQCCDCVTYSSVLFLML